MKPTVVLVALVALSLGGGSSLLLPASTALPALLTGLSLTRQFAVRPTAVAYTGDNSGFLGGFDGSPQWDSRQGAFTHLGHFSWSTWSRRQATGRGAIWGRTCWSRK